MSGTIRDQVAVVGAGCCKFGENWDRSREDMIVDAVYEAYADAGIEDPDRQIESIFCASVYPREVIKAALKHGAAAVIFAHNHPSGVAEPSAADRTLTERLKAALAQVDIRVLDHFVVGEQVVSFAERGWL